MLSSQLLQHSRLLAVVYLVTTLQSNKEPILGTKAEPLSRRDQLAAIVMQGVITANAGKSVNSISIAETTVKHTDALIKALDKQA